MVTAVVSGTGSVWPFEVAGFPGSDDIFIGFDSGPTTLRHHPPPFERQAPQHPAVTPIG